MTMSKKNKQICIILDLDRTLIDDMYKPYPNVKEFIDSIINLSDYRILWTAGNKEHLFKFLQTPFLFPPNYHLNFFKLLSGLYENTKSANLIHDLISSTNKNIKRNDIFYILIDDSASRYMNNGYDQIIDVTKYTTLSKINNIEYIEYEFILQDLKKIINKKISKNKSRPNKNNTDDDTIRNSIINVPKTYKRKRLSSNNNED
ncbi:MAG: 38K protein [Cotesia congregata filamentous virus 2]